MANDIILGSYYLIKLFNDKELPVTQLQIQKLMYFAEAYYMNKYDTNELYNEDFIAWPLGPVSETLYSKYKYYKSSPIILAESDFNRINRISDNEKKAIEHVFDKFSSLSSFTLVELTHTQCSPWSCTSPRKVIDKNQTKEWFKNEYYGINI